MFPEKLINQAKQVLNAARQKNMRISIAESCTGGLICACLTEVPGASMVLDRGFITYSNDAKMQNLGVSRKTLRDYGPVSSETALEMAEGALAASHANVSLAVTGIAGPQAGQDEKPVGLVYIATAKAGDVTVTRNAFEGDRNAIRLSAAEVALDLLQKEIDRPRGHE